MSAIRIAHISDLHYCPELLEEVDRVCRAAADEAIDSACDACVLSGDIFDHRLELPTPAVAKALELVRWLADHMPVLILQGTYSHDVRGSLDVFKTIGGVYDVLVADRVCQVALFGERDTNAGPATLVQSLGWAFDSMQEVDEFANGLVGHEPRALFSCLPPINKGAVAATAGARDVALAAGEAVLDLMKGWAVINAQAAAAGVPTVVVSHGTVNGSTTEHGVPMHGNDHEFSTGALFASGADAIMLGHIHQHQQWRNEANGRQVIAYPGSPGRLHFGELTAKGFLIWNIDPEEQTGVEFHELPAKRLVQIEFKGAPDLEALSEQLQDAKGAHVRVRWEVDEDKRDTVDKAAIERLLDGAGAAAVKLEGRIRPIQRQRAAGISTRQHLPDKLRTWCEATGVAPGPLVERLSDLQTIEVEHLTHLVVKGRPNAQGEGGAA